MNFFKKHNAIKILFLVLIATSLFCGFFVFADEGKPLEIDYPQSPIGTPSPTTTTTPLPVLIKYIFEFSIIFSLALTFLLLIFAAFKYITSVGNVDKVKSAKDQILSALLGLSILLFSYLILSTINPEILQTDFKLPSFNIKTETPEQFQITNDMNFEQIPISYLILNRFLGIENDFTKEELGSNSLIAENTKKLNNDRFNKNRLDNIWNNHGKDINGKIMYIPGTKNPYYGVSNYTLFIAEQIESLAKNLGEEMLKCSCDSSKISKGHASDGSCADSCWSNPCSGCSDYCYCYGEPCQKNRGAIRQIQTDLTWLTSAFQVYINDGWVSEWIEANEECFNNGNCKYWAEQKDCNQKAPKECYTWQEETRNVSSGTRDIISQMAAAETAFGGLAEITDDLQKQKDQMQTATTDIYNYSHTYLETTPMGFYWAEPTYKFFNAAFEEYEQDIQVNHSNWKESRSELMEISKENKEYCEKTLNGSWKESTKSIAFCNYTQEFTSADLIKDPVNSWVIFYKSSYATSSYVPEKLIEKNPLSFIKQVKAFEGLACTKNDSAKVPIGEAMRDSLDMAEKILQELKEIKEKSQLIIDKVPEFVDLPDNCLGSGCGNGISSSDDNCGANCCVTSKGCGVFEDDSEPPMCWSRQENCECTRCSGEPCSSSVSAIRKGAGFISNILRGPPFVMAQPLVNSSHTYKNCADAGGEGVLDGELPFCRFYRSSCPSGWTQYKNFNASRSNTCSICSSCTTGGNSWENRSFSCLSCSDCRPQIYVSSNTPCCHYFGYNSQISWATWCGGRSNSHVCTAIKTQIGCC